MIFLIRGTQYNDIYNIYIYIYIHYRVYYVSRYYYYDCESSQLRYLSSDTASTAIGMNPCITPQSSEHCP